MKPSPHQPILQTHKQCNIYRFWFFIFFAAWLSTVHWYPGQSVVVIFISRPEVLDWLIWRTEDSDHLGENLTIDALNNNTAGGEADNTFDDINMNFLVSSSSKQPCQAHSNIRAEWNPENSLSWSCLMTRSQIETQLSKILRPVSVWNVKYI